MACAGASVAEPTPPFAGEPSGAPDGEGGPEAFELFRRLQAHGRAVVMVVIVVQPAEAAAGAEQLTLVRGGRVADAAVGRLAHVGGRTP